MRSGARLDIGANTPLMEAAQEGHLDTIRFILNEMRSLNLPVSIFFLFRNQLLEISEKCRFGMKVMLILSRFKSAIKVDATTTANNSTALTYAAENGHLDVCAVLIEFGANIVSFLKILSR